MRIGGQTQIRGRSTIYPNYSGQMLLSVSANQRHFQDASGTPVFIHGLSYWNAFQMLGLPEWDSTFNDQNVNLLFSDMRTRGENAILCQLLTKWGPSSQSPNTADGIAPFTSTNYTTPNPAYWARMDRMVQLFAQNNIWNFVALNYAGYEGGTNQGWYTESVAAGVSVMQQWGQFVGNRYKDYGNICWLFSGDYLPARTGTDENAPRIMGALYTGLRAGGARQLAFAHYNFQTNGDEITTSTGSNFSLDGRTNYRWAVWDSNTNIPSSSVLDCYAASPTKPVFGIEYIFTKNNANLPTPRRMNQRSQYWYALTSGACGVFFGDELYCYANAPNPPFPQVGDWQDAANTDERNDYTVIRTFFRTIDQKSLVPSTGATLVNSGGGTKGNADYLCRCINATGTLAVLYTYSGASFVLNMDQFSKSMRGRWLDPTTGGFTTVTGSPFTNSGTATFNASSQMGTHADGTTDWVLVLD
jgi:hypothetical protein